MEHIACEGNQHEIAEAMKLKPDLRDYNGALPLFYSLKNDDHKMISTYFKKGKEYFAIKNYKYESIFHVAA